MNYMAQPSMPTRPMQQGFSLIELMIALILGLVIIAGVGSMFISGNRSYHTNSALEQVQSNARIAYELLARDIRQAAASGCNSSNGRVANVLKNGPNAGGTVAWWATWDNAVKGYAAGVANPAVTTGSAAANRVSGTPSFSIIRVADKSYSAKPNGSAALTLTQPKADLATGDMAIACNPDYAAIFQISDYDDDVTVTHKKGSVSPGNCSQGLGDETDCSSATGNADNFGPNTTLSRVVAHAWYIGHNAQGGKSLYRVTLLNSTGTLSTSPQEMVRNVEDMQLTYHEDGGSDFVDASAVGSWAQVDGMRVELQLKSAADNVGTDGDAIKRTFSFTTMIRSRAI